MQLGDLRRHDRKRIETGRVMIAATCGHGLLERADAFHPQPGRNAELRRAAVGAAPFCGGEENCHLANGPHRPDYEAWRAGADGPLANPVRSGRKQP